MFDYILTFDEEVLEKCKNARILEYGTTWIKDTYEFPKKIFEVSTLVGGKKITNGHTLRRDLWNRQELDNK